MPTVTTLGIDVGGTFSDIALLDASTGAVLHQAKVPTRHEDIRATLESALDTVKGFPAPHSLALASTLATNALVESKGGAVGLMLAGYPDSNVRNIPCTPRESVPGHHDVSGVEQMPLNEAAALAAGRRFAACPGVKALAVSSYGGARNAEHERRAQAILSQDLDLPVLAAVDVTNALNCETRANTVAANARLLPIIGWLVDSVLEAVKRRGWKSLVHLVRGDGTLMSPLEARERPVELVLSGPAAAALGARSMAGCTEAIVVDMGGTTTDLSLFADGRFLGLESRATAGGERGAVTVGDYALSLAIVRSRTLGLGGDSLLATTATNRLEIGPRRVVPLVRLFAAHEGLDEAWKSIAGSDVVNRHSLPPVEFFALGAAEAVADPYEQEERILEALRDGPLTRVDLARKIGYDRLGLLAVDRLSAVGAIQHACLTPTDILHALGKYTAEDPAPAIRALEFWAQRHGGSWRDVAERCRNAVWRKLALALYNVGLWRSGGQDDLPDSAISKTLFELAWNSNRCGDLGVDLRLRTPVVAVGAPAAAWIQPLAERLGTEVIVPEHASVAGAFGAACGRHEIHTQVEYRADVSGSFTVHGPQRRHVISESSEARQLAETLAIRWAHERSETAGMEEPSVATTTDEHVVEDPQTGGSMVVGGWVRAFATPAASPLLAESARGESGA